MRGRHELLISVRNPRSILQTTAVALVGVGERQTWVRFYWPTGRRVRGCNLTMSRVVTAAKASFLTRFSIAVPARAFADGASKVIALGNANSHDMTARRATSGEFGYAVKLT